MDPAFGNIDKTRNRVLQIELYMQLYGGFRLSKLRPGVDAQTQIDDGGVDGKDVLLQLNLESGIRSVDSSRFFYQRGGEVGVNAPVSCLVGSGQRGLCNLLSDAHMIEFRCVGVQTQDRVAQTLAMRHLSKCHAQKLFPTAKVPDSPVTAVTLDTTVELVVINKRQNLRKNVFAVIHKKVTKESEAL